MSDIVSPLPAFLPPPPFFAPATQATPKGTHVLSCKLHMEIKWKVRTYLFCSCKKNKKRGDLVNIWAMGWG